MRKVLLSVFIVAGLSGCLSVKQLSGKYSDEPLAASFDASKDDVWQAVIETVVNRNLPINVLEKESGIVSSYQSSYVSRTTYEYLKKAEPIHKNAYIITHRPNSLNDSYLAKLRSTRFTQMFPFEELTGRWKIFVKPTGGGKTEVSVVLSGFEYVSSKGFSSIPHRPEIYSLKIFEREILDDISSKLK